MSFERGLHALADLANLELLDVIDMDHQLGVTELE